MDASAQVALIEKEPLVSIIINNYNYVDFLQATIDSALSQTYKNVEVIVVDDGSTDSSRDLIAKYSDRIIPVLKANGGQASALNAGFMASKGTIICLLDADDLFLPEKVSEVVRLFLSQPGIDWVFTESAPVQSDELLNKDLKSLFKEIFEQNSEMVAKKIDFRASIRSAKLPDFTPSTSNLCFSRSILDKIFPMPEVKGTSGIAICDTYLKLVAVGLGTGYSFPKNLGIFRLHSNNLFSTQQINQKRQVIAEIFIATGYWMLVKFPELHKLGKKLFSKGLGTYWKIGYMNAMCNSFLKDHKLDVPLLEQLEVKVIAFYYFLKLHRTESV